MPGVAQLPQLTEPRPLLPRLSAGRLGLVLLLLIALPCFLSLPWSISRYRNRSEDAQYYQPPSLSAPMGTDGSGYSVAWRCLLGGAVSLSVGLSAALIAVLIGVSWGAIAGYVGGRTDAFMMRIVDILYGLPYVLLVVLLNFSLGALFEQKLAAVMGWFIRAEKADDAAKSLAGLLILMVAIGGLSWLTMARVIRGQVLSLRAQPFIEAARATGVGPWRMLRVHLLPNLVGPIVVYATLAVPSAILQESFLSFLGIGVQPPLPSWGNLAKESTARLADWLNGGVLRWWVILWPCMLLGLTLLALNFLGDALRNRLDPRGVQ